MKTTLFLATYYNNPHFIELQSKTLNRFIKDDFNFVVLDDSDVTTKSFLSGNLAKSEIKEQCNIFNVGYKEVPQYIHEYYRNGGYVPNENPTTDHVTERHQALIRWLFANYKSFGYDQYKYLALFDADIFFRKEITMSEYMIYDFIGTGRDQTINLPLNQFPANQFSDRVRQINGEHINFLTLCIFFVNLQKVNNLETMDIGSWPHTDTGSKTTFFMRDNPQYTYHILKCYPIAEQRTELYSREYIIGDIGGEIVHYRAGSNWSYESRDYYQEKLNRMLQQFIPDLVQRHETVTGISSRDGEHIL